MRGPLWWVVLSLFSLVACADPEPERAEPADCADGSGGSPEEPVPVLDPPDPVDCAGHVFFSEDFEGTAAGDALGPAWRLVVEGPNSAAGVNLDEEGRGAGESARYALFANRGSYPDSVEVSATFGPLDVRACAVSRLSFAMIIFSLEESENDHAFVEVRANGGDWIPLYMPFPSPDFAPQPDCRAGGQETGCVAWKTLSFEIPRVAIGPDLEIRFRMQALTDVSDFAGFDDVALVSVQ